MKRLKLMLLRWREAGLLAQVADGEVLLMETRARLQLSHQKLRQVRSSMAALRPARELLDEAMRRRDAEIGRRHAANDEQPSRDARGGTTP